MSKKMSTDEFIIRAMKIHGGKYDYSKVDYKSIMKKVCIICPKHGEFWQTPNNHLNNGNECPKCAHRSYKKTAEEFVNEARLVHGNKYDYSKVEYKNKKTKVCIICPEHGEFWQTPEKHLSGQGCQKCGGVYKPSTEEFIEKARKIHGEKYDYSKVNYINTETKVCIICPEHGEFWQTPHAHLSGKGCKYCATNRKITQNEFIERAKTVHGNKFDYSLAKYVNDCTKVCIKCNECGEYFYKTPADHIRHHQGCPVCSQKRYVSENFLFEKIKDIYPKTIKQYRPSWLKNGKGQQSIDIFIPDINVGIEYQGGQHFNDKYCRGNEKNSIIKKRDTIKYEKCKENGLKLYYFTFEKNRIPENYIDKIFIDIKELIDNIVDYAKNYAGNRENI